VAFMERLAPAYGDDWWYRSALAFTYHEVDRFEESRRLSEASLRQYPRNAHASHNLAHIAFETLDVEAGAAFLDDWMAGYDRRASFHCHLAWHQAMFALHERRYAKALDIFERDILRSGNPRSAMTDGTALLWRVKLDRASEQPLPWRSLAELAAKVSRPGFLFGEVHAAFAYAACGDEAALARMMDGLRALGEKGHPIAASLVLPLVQGTAAFAAGRPRGGAAPLRAVRGGDAPHWRQPRPVGDLRGDHGGSATWRSSATTTPRASCAVASRAAPRRAISSGSPARAAARRREGGPRMAKLTLKVNGTRREVESDDPRHPASVCPERRSRADRHPLRLRPRAVRGVHRAGRRPRRPLVHRAGKLRGRAGGGDDRGPGLARSAPIRCRPRSSRSRPRSAGTAPRVMVMSARALLAQTPRPTEQQVREGLAGNLCRCGSHARVIRAVLRAAAATPRAR